MGWQDDTVVAKAPWEKDEVVTPAKTVEPPKPVTKDAAVGDMIPQVGAAEAAASLGSGTVATPVAGLAGLGASIAKAFGITDADPVEVIKKVQAALTYEPRSESAKKAVDVVAAPFELLAKGAQAASDKTFEVTGSPALATAVNTGINVGVPIALTKGAQAVSSSLKAGVEASKAKALTRNQQAVDSNRIITQSKEAGYTLPPSQVNPSLTNKALEGVSGAPKVAKRGSIQNQPITNEIIRKDIGLPDDMPASRESLAALRAEAGQAYEAIKQVGTITNDTQYFKDLKNITKSYDTAAESYKGVANPVADVVKILQEDAVQAPAAIEMVKILRGKADVAYRAGDSPLGKAYKQSAQAIDDSLNRYLQTEAEFFADPKMADAVAKYQAARTQIAKTYMAEKALTSSGNFNAMAYARELKKGRPLDGGALQVAEFAEKFPNFARLPEKVGGDTFGFGDVVVGGAKTMATGDVLKGVASLGVRPGVRAMVTSKPYQKLMVNAQKETPSLGRMSLSALADLQSSPVTTLAEISAERR